MLFRSVQGAFAAERRLLDAGVAHKLVPVPRHLRATCGFGLRFGWADREAVEDVLESAPLGVEGVVQL